MRFALIVSAALFATSAHANLITNGSFETPRVALGGYAQFFAGQSFGGWTVSGSDVVLIEQSYSETDDGNTVTFNADTGVQALDITGAGNSGLNRISQTVVTRPGKRYALSFAVGVANDFNGGRFGTPSSIRAYAGGNLLGTFTNSTLLPGGVNFRLFTTSFVAPSASTTIEFENATAGGDAGGNYYAGLDSVDLVIDTPAPAAVGLFGLSALGIGVARRRR
ncbi:MAG: DUF642 domain-containing protein [Sphingomonadaceae bacterium]|nr:DUF642 domain-containing protein [Sphingomonadaceae bacterium]